MHAVKTFGRRAPALQTLGEPAPPPTAVPSCTFPSYLGDSSTPDSSTYGTQTAIISAALVGVGWLLGGIVPIVGRPIGSLVGAGAAGAVALSRYSSWQTAGGTTHQPGACGSK